MAGQGLTITKIDVRGLERLIKEAPEKADQALRMAAAEIEGDIKQSMIESPRTGRSYPRGRGRVHVASEPGKPPRPDMGTLMNSIRSERMGHLHYQVRDGVDYGILLEEGRERTAPRPFVAPVFEAWRSGKFANLLAKEFGI